MNAVRETLSAWWSAIREKIASYPRWLVDLVVFSIVGFFMGYIAKRIGSLTLIVFLFIVLALIILDYLQIISLQSLLGYAPDLPVRQMLSNVLTHIQEHAVAAIALISGFLLGWHIA